VSQASEHQLDITRILTVDDDQGRLEHLAIRHDVFVDEQGIFAQTDEDFRDGEPDTIHLIGMIDGRTVGAVRLYPLDARREQWQGDRLAVLQKYRTSHLGIELVQEAVARATANGGQAMHAHIQLPNVRFFEYLGWYADGPIENYAGLLHQQMVIDLTQNFSDVG